MSFYLKFYLKCISFFNNIWNCTHCNRQSAAFWFSHQKTNQFNLKLTSGCSASKWELLGRRPKFGRFTEQFGKEEVKQLNLMKCRSYSDLQYQTVRGCGYFDATSPEIRRWYQQVRPDRRCTLPIIVSLQALNELTTLFTLTATFRPVSGYWPERPHIFPRQQLFECLVYTLRHSTVDNHRPTVLYVVIQRLFRNRQILLKTHLFLPLHWTIHCVFIFFQPWCCAACSRK